jgi:stearoyl-CoA 9-desaturase NADPH oxidoreductase
MSDVRVRHGYTRTGQGDVEGHVSAGHLAQVMPFPDAVYVCGPRALVDAVRQHRPGARSESFQPPLPAPAGESSGGRVVFAESGIAVDSDGRSLLQQAESAGLAPANGCRMGICHTCTLRKTRGVVRNLTTGAVSTSGCEDVQICVSVPVGEVELAL